MNQTRGKITVFSSSLVELSTFAPLLQSLNLSACTFMEDQLIKETGEYVSSLNFDIPHYYSRIPITSIESVRILLLNCPQLSHLDLSWCEWVRLDHLKLITEHSKNLKSLNLIGCSHLHNNLMKLFNFSSNEELVQYFNSIFTLI